MLSWVDRSYEEIVKDIQYSISSAYRVPKSRFTNSNTICEQLTLDLTE